MQRWMSGLENEFVGRFKETAVDYFLIFFNVFISNQRGKTIYKPMCWWYKVRYDNMYYNDVVVCSSSDVTWGALLSLKASIVWPNLRYYTSICLEALRRNAEVIIRVVNIRTDILTGEPRTQTEALVTALARCSVSLVNAPTNNMLFP